MPYRRVRAPFAIARPALRTTDVYRVSACGRLHDGVHHDLDAYAIVERWNARPSLSDRVDELGVLVPPESLQRIDTRFERRTRVRQRRGRHGDFLEGAVPPRAEHAVRMHQLIHQRAFA